MVGNGHDSDVKSCDMMIYGHVVFLTFFSFMFISASMNTDFYIDFNSYCNSEIHKNAFSIWLVGQVLTLP